MCGRAVRNALLSIAAHAALAGAWSTSRPSACVAGSVAPCLADSSPRAHNDQVIVSAPGMPRDMPRTEPVWLRAFLAALTMFVVVIGAAPKFARAEGNIQVWYGQGNFWHVQHFLTVDEKKVLGRGPGSYTALVGYAGGTEVGPNKEVCFHPFSDVPKQQGPEFSTMGHLQAVNVSVPEDKVGDFSKNLLDAAFEYPRGRSDPRSRGAEFRSAIGLPGGMNGPAFKQIEKVSAGRLKFLKGMGGDEDTVGTKEIYIYDTAEFPFHQGEIYLQYHDDIRGGDPKYSKKYHDLNALGRQSGVLKNVGCPEDYIDLERDGD